MANPIEIRCTIHPPKYTQDIRDFTSPTSKISKVPTVTSTLIAKLAFVVDMTHSVTNGIKAENDSISDGDPSPKPWLKYPWLPLLQ